MRDTVDVVHSQEWIVAVYNVLHGLHARRVVWLCYCMCRVCVDIGIDIGIVISVDIAMI